MIKEDYVSFETAKLLKEKEFEGDVNAYYHIWDNGNRVCPVQEFSHSNAPHLYIPASSQSMVMKWLREIHNIHIIVHPYTDKEGQHWGFYFDKFTYDCWIELGIYITDSWNTYEEAA